uniref:RNase H type-1 domain-containing protein n=1 Tax=Brassica oleracea var. oleracea TaxID=109376 RepID=A0A0D3CY26_BRAOL
MKFSQGLYYIYTHRCNTDAVWKSDSTTAGIGWIFTAPSTLEVNSGSKVQMHVSSPLLAEALAIREALQQAISLKFTYIWVRSDSQVLVRAIDRNRSSSELHGVLSGITGLASSFIFCFFFPLLSLETQMSLQMP